MTLSVVVAPPEKANWLEAIEPSSVSVSKGVEPALMVTAVSMVPLTLPSLDEKVVEFWARPVSEMVSPTVNPPIAGNSEWRPPSPLIVHRAPESMFRAEKLVN